MVQESCFTQIPGATHQDQTLWNEPSAFSKGVFIPGHAATAQAGTVSSHNHRLSCTAEPGPPVKQALLSCSSHSASPNTTTLKAAANSHPVVTSRPRGHYRRLMEVCTPHCMVLPLGICRSTCAFSSTVSWIVGNNKDERSGFGKYRIHKNMCALVTGTKTVRHQEYAIWAQTIIYKSTQQ